jgi:hypothetical protein
VNYITFPNKYIIVLKIKDYLYRLTKYSFRVKLFIKGCLKELSLVFISKTQMAEKLDNNKVEKTKSLIIIEIIEYVPCSVVIKSI